MKAYGELAGKTEAQARQYIENCFPYNTGETGLDKFEILIASFVVKHDVSWLFLILKTRTGELFQLAQSWYHPYRNSSQFYVTNVSYNDLIQVYVRQSLGENLYLRPNKDSWNWTYTHINSLKFVSQTIIPNDLMKDILSICPLCKCWFEGDDMMVHLDWELESGRARKNKKNKSRVVDYFETVKLYQTWLSKQTIWSLTNKNELL